jgi:uncharacterized membrane protein
MIVFALLIGIIAGLRALTAPAAVSWAAYSRGLPLDGTILAFLGYRFTLWILSLLALAELVTDQLPGTPSRKVPPQFFTRMLMGGLSGGAIGAAMAMLWPGVVLGIVGAVLGTYGGAAARARLASAFGRDLPAALIEDAVAILGAALIVTAL